MKDYKIELKCEKESNRVFERVLELNSYESSLATMYTIIDGIRKDNLIGAFELTLAGGGMLFTFKKEYPNERQDSEARG